MFKKLSISDDTIDMVTPPNDVLSAKYRRSFAYTTIRDRLPVTITNVIDLLVRDKDKIVDDFGEPAKEELKEIIGSFSKLKNELQTNKSFELLTSDGSDVPAWNAYYQKETEKEGVEPKWFKTSWLYAECYMYRRLRHSFELSTSMKTFDPFRKNKKEAFYKSLDATTLLGDLVLQNLELRNLSDTEIKEKVIQLLKVTLWGNQYDLSRPIGSELTQENDPLKNIESLQDNLLVDDSEKFWTSLMGAQEGSVTVDFINDNAGYEIFSDMCLADALCTFSLANKVCFYLKALPWFISDTMEYDFHWVLRKLSQLSNRSSSLPTLASRWEGYLQSGKWTIEVEDFWTLPHTFSEMKEVDPDLYNKLSQATLIIFKGDLNYRKLLGEINWPPTESFTKTLQGFHPAPLITLRTIKADLICGLKPGQAEKLNEKSDKWLITGDYAVIQFDG